jgi:hypothetical protein
VTCSAAGGGGGGTILINDPQNPGASFSTPLQGNGPAQISSNGTLNLATVSGQATVNGGRAFLTCGVTGNASFSLTITTPGGVLLR